MTSDTLTISLLSVIVGALLGGLINAAVGRYSAFKESQGVAAALHGEMSALLDLVRTRGYVEHLREVIRRLGDPSHVPGPGDVFAIGVSQSYFSIFEGNASKIGLLGSDLAASVVRSYMLAKAIVEDFTGLRELQHDLLQVPSIRRLDRQVLLEMTIRLRDLLLAAEREGRVAIRQLRQYQSRRWHAFDS